MSNKNLIAIFIAMAMMVWLFSGELTSNVVIADDSMGQNESNLDEPETIPLVRAIHSRAHLKQQLLEVSGQTRANRIVQVKAEVSGRVERVAAEKGSFVKTGDLLCKIAIDTRQGEYEKAKADLQSSQIEYDGILDLKRRSYQSDVNVAKAKAALETSKSAAIRAELALKKTNVVAPFSGVVDSQPVEIGDFLNVGQVCVTLIEIDPILVVGQISESHIADIVMGGLVNIKLISGEKLQGVVSFIGRAPDAATRTYPVEVTVKEPGENIRIGLSAHMSVPQGQQLAHLISSAAFVLNDNGEVGVRIIDDNDRVKFVTVQRLADDVKGTWVTGLPEVVNLITVGQEEVFDGELVRADYSALGSVVSS